MHFSQSRKKGRAPLLKQRPRRQLELATLFHGGHGLLGFVHAAIGAHGLLALWDVVHRLAFMARRVEDHIKLLGESGSDKGSGQGRGVLLAAVIAGASAFAVPAIAGECPADQKKPNAREAVDLKPVGVTDTTIAAIDVSKAPFNIDGRNFRMRKLVVEPGGIVPWHSHADRPAIIYITEGEIHEYASNCAGPIVHKAGDVVAETPEISHWWKNLGDTTAVLLSADLLKDTTDHNM